MKRRTVSADDLETMAHAAHERVALPGPEGGWATATINGHFYRALVAPVPVEDRWKCAVIACGAPVGEPHIPECPYAERGEGS